MPLAVLSLLVPKGFLVRLCFVNEHLGEGQQQTLYKSESINPSDLICAIGFMACGHLRGHSASTLSERCERTRIRRGARARLRRTVLRAHILLKQLFNNF